jgi:hypothetical protein
MSRTSGHNASRLRADYAQTMNQSAMAMRATALWRTIRKCPRDNADRVRAKIMRRDIRDDRVSVLDLQEKRS